MMGELRLKGSSLRDPPDTAPGSSTAAECLPGRSFHPPALRIHWFSFQLTLALGRETFEVFDLSGLLFPSRRRQAREQNSLGF